MLLMWTKFIQCAIHKDIVTFSSVMQLSLSLQTFSQTFSGDSKRWDLKYTLLDSYVKKRFLRKAFIFRLRLEPPWAFCSSEGAGNDYLCKSVSCRLGEG